MIKLVAGLGNPGRKYSKTRHNLGYMVVDCLAAKFKSSFRKKKGDFRQSVITISGLRAILIKSTTFMNLSGVAVLQSVRLHSLNPNDILVISDDINLPLGKLRIRERGSDGGHKGLKSITEELGTQSFARLRLGVGLPEEPDYPAEEFVLERFNDDEKKLVQEMIENAASAVETMILDGLDAAQQKYN